MARVAMRQSPTDPLSYLYFKLHYTNSVVYNSLILHHGRRSPYDSPVHICEKNLQVLPNGRHHSAFFPLRETSFKKRQMWPAKHEKIEILQE
jgi:hypothetical protein